MINYNLLNSLLSLEEFNNEFILNSYDKNIYKYLFYSTKKENNNIILDVSIIYGVNNIYILNKIFDIFNFTPIHFGINLNKNVTKIYISLYNESFKDSLKIIKKIKEIIGIKKKYFLEKDFYKFDCIGIDISERGFDLKIYELVKSNNNFIGLPDFINRKDVKEIGYLKNFDGRRKKFFRFNKYQDLYLFDSDFYLENLNKKNNYFILENKVKYYCLEGDKREIYFI